MLSWNDLVLYNNQPPTYSRTDGASQDASLLSEGLLPSEPLHQATWKEGTLIYKTVRPELTHGGDTLVTSGDGGGRGRGQQEGEGQEGQLHCRLGRLESGHEVSPSCFIGSFILDSQFLRTSVP